ncbi:MAG: hypothetical protein EOM59_11750 [Clostridia bacterium]|nr:hypothetical protein [Clostridia bacterium]
MGNDIIIKDIGEEKEQILQGSNQLVVSKANLITVTNSEEYGQAAEFLKDIKTGITTVKNTFSDMKAAANAAHKAICDKENSFIKPLEEANLIIRKKMQGYNDEIERKRREDEARLREEQRKLAEEQMKKALELEQAGKTEQAQETLNSVTALENMKPFVRYETPKVSGVSTSVDYDIQITDARAVPAYLNGIELREINLSAIKQLAKASKGEIQISGVNIVKTNLVKVR